MKTTKKILAALLVVLMLAMMIPVSASAASTYTLNVTGHADFTFKLYKVADFNVEEGTYSNFASDAVEDALTTEVNGKLDSAAFLTACNALTDTQLGTEVAEFTSSYTNDNIGAGAYFVKVVEQPQTVKKAGNSAFAIPYIADNGDLVTDVTVNAGSKCDNGTLPPPTKTFSDTQVTDRSANYGDVIPYTITTGIIGSADAKLQSYKVNDKMDKGLTFNETSLEVKLTGDAGERELTDTEYSVDFTAATNEFVVTLDPTNLLGTDAFYDYSSVVVTYTATVNEEATIASTGNKNEMQLIIKNNPGEEFELTPPTIPVVYVFEIDVVKVDSVDNNKKLAGATFGLYADADCTDEIATGVTGADGVFTFSGLAKGTYYVKELAAPEGYVLNPNVITVVLDYTKSGDEAVPSITVGNDTVDQVVVENTRILVPETGGAGTILFTIGGATLIALAGVLFLVVRRKKNA